MSSSKHITVNWRGQTYVFEAFSTVEYFDNSIRVRFNLNPDPMVNPTGVKVVIIERYKNGTEIAVSERGIDLKNNPALRALESWMDSYVALWKSLHENKQ